MGLEDLFNLPPRPERDSRSLERTSDEDAADLVAGLRAGFGREAAEQAIGKVLGTRSPGPDQENLPAAFSHLVTSLEKLTHTYGEEEEVLASLKKAAENQS